MIQKGSVVEVIALSSRIKNRVASHGSVMTIYAVGPKVIDGVKYDLCLESLDNTFSLGGGKKTKWSGWVRNVECNLRELIE